MTRTEILAANSRNAQKAAELLRRGKIVAYPTETSYALGCDATNARAVERIFSLKGRNRGKPLPVIVESLKAVERYALLDGRAIALAKKFMPGPLTLVVEARKDAFPKNLSSSGIAFRISSHSFARSLARELGRPVVSTSANPSGKPSIFSAEKIIELYYGKVDAVVSAGELEQGTPSTIVDLRGEKPILARRGRVAFAKVLKQLKSLKQ